MSDDAGILIMEIRRHGKSDRSPIQMISTERLAYLHQMEAEALYLRKVVQAVRLAIVSDFAEKPDICGKVSDSPE